MKIFIDFDDTLFDRQRLTRDIYEAFGDVAPSELEGYYRAFRETAPFTIDGFAAYLNERHIAGDRLRDLFLSKLSHAQEYVFPDARAFLESLRLLDHELILLTVDEEPEKWQQPKVNSSGLTDLFHRVEITRGVKADVLKGLSLTEPFVFIDDKAAELENMLKEFSDAVCVKHEPGSALASHLVAIAAAANRRELTALPLPMDTRISLGHLAASDGERLEITFGLDERAIQAFKKRSCDKSDEELMRFTSDYERMCLGSYETWYAKERYPFALLSKTGELAGIIWFGPKEFPAIKDGNAPAAEDAWHTFAIRMYGEYRGKRLAYPFASFVFEAYTHFLPHHPVWLDTDIENNGAIRLYAKLGFIECGHIESGRVVMARA